MRFIDNYNDYISALRDKASEDATIRNDAKKALGILRQTDPEQYDGYKARYEGIELPKPIVSKKTRMTSIEPRHTRIKPKMSEQEIREKVLAILMKDGLKYVVGVPAWITVEDVLISLSKLEISDLITEKGNIVKRNTILRKCFILAAAEGRISEARFRQFILNKCKVIWGWAKFNPGYSFKSVEWFIMRVVKAEELAETYSESGVNFIKLVNLILDKRIARLDINKLKEKDLNEKIEKMRNENPSEIRNIAKKTWHYIDKRLKANKGFHLPDNCKAGALKAAIEKICDDDLYSAFDGKMIDANKLYDLCIEVLTKSN